MEMIERISLFVVIAIFYGVSFACKRSRFNGAPKNYTYCDGRGINEGMWRTGSKSQFPAHFTGCHMSDEEGCEVAISCHVYPPTTNEDRCFMLSWMIFKSLYWPNPQFIHQEKQRVTVHIALSVKREGGATQSAKLPMLTLEKALPRVQRFFRDVHNAKFVNISTKIEHCRYYAMAEEDRPEIPPMPDVTEKDLFFAKNESFCEKEFNGSCEANCGPGTVEWNHPYGIPVCNFSNAKCCRDPDSIPIEVVIPKAVLNVTRIYNENNVWNFESCGHASPHPAGHSRVKRLAGATVSSPGQWPWVMSLVDVVQNRPHFCQVLLIAPQWGLTALHCFYRFESPPFFRIRARQHDLYHPDINEREHEIEAVYKHPNFSVKMAQEYEPFCLHDIAIVKLKVPVEDLEPVCLPNVLRTNPTGKSCWQAGWGRTRDSGKNSSRFLRYLSPAYVPGDECASIYNYNITSMPEILTCFGNGTIGGCHGDSGSGVTCLDDVGRHVLEGISSYGNNGCRTDSFHPSVFGKVSLHVPWIRQQIHDDLVLSGLNES